MVALAKLPPLMTVDEFLTWSADQDGRWQLVDGEPCAMAPPALLHGALQGELGGLIGNHLLATNAPCLLIVTPGVVPRFLADTNMRVPDLAVTCAPHAPDASAMTDPVLIVEILSPGNQAATWSNVHAYTSIPSLRDILVLRTDRIGASLLHRGADWPTAPAEYAEGALVLESLGLTLDLDALYGRAKLLSR